MTGTRSSKAVFKIKRRDSSVSDRGVRDEPQCLDRRQQGAQRAGDIPLARDLDRDKFRPVRI